MQERNYTATVSESECTCLSCNQKPTGSQFSHGGKDLRKKYLLSLDWKRVGVMDNDSGDDGTDELRQFG